LIVVSLLAAIGDQNNNRQCIGDCQTAVRTTAPPPSCRRHRHSRRAAAPPSCCRPRHHRAELAPQRFCRRRRAAAAKLPLFLLEKNDGSAGCGLCGLQSCKFLLF